MYACTHIQRLVHRGNADVGWSRGYNLASLRPITTYKMVSGGVSAQ